MQIDTEHLLSYTSVFNIIYVLQVVHYLSFTGYHKLSAPLTLASIIVLLVNLEIFLTSVGA